DALRAVVPSLSGPRRAVCWRGSVIPVGAGHRSVQRCRTDLGAVEGHALVAEVHAAGLIGLVGLPLADLDHDEVRALGLDQRQFVVRLADDVPEAARFTGAVDVGGFDRDRLLAGVQCQLRVLGLVRGLGGLRGLGLIVGILGVFGTVVESARPSRRGVFRSGALGLDQRQFVVRLGGDVPEAGRFTGAGGVGGFDRDRLLARVQCQLRVLGLVRGLGGLRGLGLIVGILGVFGTVVGILGLVRGLLTLIDRLRALGILGCGLLGFVGTGATAESEELGNGNGGDRSGTHVSIIGEQWGRGPRKPGTTNV